MEISRSLNYAFEDKEWLSKLGLGALISLVPVLNFAWLGYTVALIRQVEAGQPLPLPAWDDLEKKLLDGLKLGAAMLLYSLPLFVLILVPIVFIVLPAFVQNDDLQGILAAVGGLGFLATLCVVGLYGLALGFFYPAIQLHYARTGTFAACFQWGRILQLIRDHRSNYVTAWAASLVIGLGFSVVISTFSGVVGWIPCLGQILILAVIPISFLAGMWVTTVHAFLFGQITRPKSA